MINAIRKGHNVKRFHTTERIREETVGHHSAGVAAILLRLSPDCRREVLVYALMHDVAEAFTGDVPFTAKRDSAMLTEELDDMEEAYINHHDIPDEELTVEEYTLFKLADMLDLVLSSLEELNRGNRYARTLIDNGQKFIQDMDLPDEILAKVVLMVQEVKNDGQ